MADDNLFQQYLRPPKSVLEYSAEYDQADARKQALRQNALELAAGQQKYDDGVAARQRAEQLRQTLMGLPQGTTDEQRVQAMRGTGTQEGFAAADALDKSLVERRKGAASAAKDEADTADKEYKLQVARHDRALRDMSSFRTPQEALLNLQQHAAAGELPPEQAQMFAAQLQTINPKDFPAWQMDMMRRLMSATDEMKSREDARQFNATEARIRSEGDKNRAVTLAGQNKVDARAREANMQSKVPSGYRFTSTGSLEAIPGGPAATKVTEQQTRLADAQTVLDLLDLADPLIDKSTQGYLGLGVDMASRALGRSTPGAEAAAELKALEGALVSKMPKMSGPQSDKDVLLYRQMAGQIGDPTIPAPTKRAAMRTIRNINQRYLDAGGAPSARQSKPVDVLSAADAILNGGK